MRGVCLSVELVYERRVPVTSDGPLCYSHHYRKSHESDGQRGIVQEELMAFVNVRVRNIN